MDRDSQIREALRHLVFRGAFTRIDAPTGEVLAGLSAYTLGQVDEAKELLLKYKEPLDAAGIVVNFNGDSGATAEPAFQPAGFIRYMPSLKMISVSFPFDLSVVETARTLKDSVGGRFERNLKSWLYPPEAVHSVIEVFPGFLQDGSIEKLVEEQKRESKGRDDMSRLRAGLSELVRSAVDLDNPDILQMACSAGTCAIHPEGSGGVALGHPLKQHQKEFAQVAFEEWKVILADDMGLGKTISALVVAKAIQKVTGCAIIVVARSSLHRRPWLRDAERVGVHIEIYSNHANKIPVPPESRKFVLIADEAHDYQNLRARRTQAMLRLAKSPNCIAAYPATGTPIKNGRPCNLWPLLVMVDHELAKDRKFYERRYCAAQPTRFSRWDITGAAHLGELHSRLGRKMVRRLKKDRTDLPPKTRMVEQAEFTVEAAEAYQQKLRELVAKYKARREERLAEGMSVGGGEILTMMGALRQASALGKVPTAVSMATELVEQGRKCVIYAINIATVNEVSRRLSEAGIKHELLTGGTGSNKDHRDEMNDRFQSGDSMAFVMTDTGGVGVDLFAADTIIMIDRPWTPGDAVQIEDRLHRMGQTKNVTSIWLQYEEIDEKVDNILVEKQEKIDLVLEGKARTLRGVEDIGGAVRAIMERHSSNAG